jgi:KipI family sensor histidine kinase inhibitor
MIYPESRLLPAGDTAILIEWADEIDDDVNDRVHALAQALRDQSRPEIRDLIPAYSSLLICYDPHRVGFAQMRAFLQALLQSPQAYDAPPPRLIEIPTVYGGKFGPDLAFVAQHNGITEVEVIRLHASVTYRVYLIGFAPGFAYLGSVPQQIAAPRLETPRTRVAAGSVGIAGRQTGIYPMETPGGWRLIGHTDARLFDPSRDPPTLLRPGDRVRFVPVGKC